MGTRKILREKFVKTKDLSVLVSTTGTHYSDDYVHWLEELVLKNANIEDDIAVKFSLAVQALERSDESSLYQNIQNKEEYDLLLKSSMFWVAHPELSGDWEKDGILYKVDSFVSKTH